jgi:hypothetical protein
MTSCCLTLCVCERLHLPGAATEGLGKSHHLGFGGRPGFAASNLALIQARNRLFLCQEYT